MHGNSILYHTAMSGDLEIAEMLMANGGTTATAGDAIHGAVQHDRVEMVRWLLEHGANPNALDFNRKTPLAVAVANGQEEIAALLRASGGLE